VTHVKCVSPCVCPCVRAHPPRRPLLGSSYLGYGTVTLGHDTAQLVNLVRYLRDSLGVTRVVVCGHSTGCQNWLHFLGHADPALAALVVGVVLQGPVSDRDYAATLPETPALLATAKDLVDAGHGEVLLPREAGPAPITATRYLVRRALWWPPYCPPPLTPYPPKLPLPPTS
jgi:pimeloyl-ACP methyl ester carboxylesterase